MIVRLTDANRDGVADSVVTIARGLKGPFGIAFRGDTMYVAAEQELVRFDPGARDPVGMYEEYLKEEGTAEQVLRDVEADITAQVERAAAEALASREKMPEGTTALGGVYASRS